MDHRPIKGLPLLLLVVVVVRHYGADVLAQFYGDTDFARRALFYALGGIQGVVLYAVVWALTPFKPTYVRIGVSILCAWGMLEEAQVAVCRFAWGIERKTEVSMWQGLCDSLSGWPVTMGTLLVVLVALVALRTKE